MAVRFYLRNATAPYSPATFRGAWDDTASAVTKLLDSAARLGTWDSATSVAKAETSTNTEYDVLLYRGVSGKLKAGTIGTGTVNVMLPIYESNADADFAIHLHLYVTQGDSDTPRGTLLDNYRDPTGNELTASNATAGIDLDSAQALSSVAVSDNDRIVAEIGYVARNASATSRTGTLYYGQSSRPDLVHGGRYDSGNGYIEFSEAFAFIAEGRVSQGAVEVAVADTPSDASVSQAAVEVLFIHDPNATRLSQAVAEAALTRTAGSGLRLSQVIIEVIRPGVIPARVSQMVVEVANAPMRPVRVSQHLVEVLAVMPTYCGAPTLSPAVLCGKPDVLAWLEWSVTMKET